jgi:hypothetical protein
MVVPLNVPVNCWPKLRREEMATKRARLKSRDILVRSDFDIIKSLPLGV